jgi:quinolinate synthase
MQEILKKIEILKKEKNAVILSHTYQPAEIQDIADYVGDSYQLSVEATKTSADVIIFCGVMFMAETAAILNPNKKVFIPEPSSGCPMADMITVKELLFLKDKYPDYEVVCYVNSLAEIKALSDVCCTSSNAIKIVSNIPEDKGIIFIPDKHLGEWIKEKTQRNIILWDGFCPTHVRITAEKILAAKKEHPDAIVLVHPEVPKEARMLADYVFSTGGMCNFVSKDNHKEYIIGTETGIIHTLKKNNLNKKFYPVSDLAICPNMKKTNLELVAETLDGKGGKEVKVPQEISDKARKSLQRMLEMSK